MRKSLFCTMGSALLMLAMAGLPSLAHAESPALPPPASGAAAAASIDSPLPGDVPGAAEPVGSPRRAAASGSKSRSKASAKRSKAGKAKAVGKKAVGKKAASKKTASKSRAAKSLKKHRK